MKYIFYFSTVVTLGLILGVFTGIDPIKLPVFEPFSSIALILALYVSVSSINLHYLGKYKRTAIWITTLGVPVQILVTGLIMYAIFPHPVSFLLAAAIDQIDPLSVSALIKDKIGMSIPAKNLLRIWSSFDDPVTVLVGFTLFVPLFTAINTTNFLVVYLVNLLLNITMAGLFFLFYKNFFEKASRHIQIFVLLLSFIFAFFTNGFLFIALIGLFLRPIPSENYVRLIDFLYFGVLLLVGMSTVNAGIDLRLGLILALISFFIVQPLSAIIMVNGNTNDIFRLAFAQQNGITTILMGLSFQALGFNVIPILLPAILIINLLNLFVNNYYTWKQKKGYLVGTNTVSYSTNKHSTD